MLHPQLRYGIQLLGGGMPVLELEGALASLVGLREQVPQAASLHEVHCQDGVALHSQQCLMPISPVSASVQ